MVQKLIDKFEIVKPEERADIYIINTCSRSEERRVGKECSISC